MPRTPTGAFKSAGESCQSTRSSAARYAVIPPPTVLPTKYRAPSGDHDVVASTASPISLTSPVTTVNRSTRTVGGPAGVGDGVVGGPLGDGFPTLTRSVVPSGDHEPESTLPE